MVLEGGCRCLACAPAFSTDAPCMQLRASGLQTSILATIGVNIGAMSARGAVSVWHESTKMGPFAPHDRAHCLHSVGVR